MMYWKLAIQNIRRSLRDYIIYFVTLTLTAALMYSFLALGFSSDVLAMAENMSMLTTGILLMSALVAFMSSFVIGYAIRFMDIYAKVKYNKPEELFDVVNQAFIQDK